MKIRSFTYLYRRFSVNLAVLFELFLNRVLCLIVFVCSSVWIMFTSFEFLHLAMQLLLRGYKSLLTSHFVFFPAIITSTFLTDKWVGLLQITFKRTDPS